MSPLVGGPPTHSTHSLGRLKDVRKGCALLATVCGTGTSTKSAIHVTTSTADGDDAVAVYVTKQGGADAQPVPVAKILPFPDAFIVYELREGDRMQDPCSVAKLQWKRLPLQLLCNSTMEAIPVQENTSTPDEDCALTWTLPLWQQLQARLQLQLPTPAPLRPIQIVQLYLIAATDSTSLHALRSTTAKVSPLRALGAAGALRFMIEKAGPAPSKNKRKKRKPKPPASTQEVSATGHVLDEDTREINEVETHQVEVRQFLNCIVFVYQTALRLFVAYFNNTSML